MAMLSDQRGADDAVRTCLARALDRPHKSGEAARLRVWLLAMITGNWLLDLDRALGGSPRHRLGILSAQWRLLNYPVPSAGYPWNSAVPCS